MSCALSRLTGTPRRLASVTAAAAADAESREGEATAAATSAVILSSRSSRTRWESISKPRRSASLAISWART